ncbi:MAG: hypothetical protein C0594_06950 [Marinilabiliales bacterium]|nr:MAG: hypothetical protein C0594_06950 [Marinilabiliales bacterium]
MKKINLILDYKDRFETKYTAVPYRSGMDHSLLQQYFREEGFNAEFLHYTDIDFNDPELAGQIFLYCSSEDHDGYYKSFIEDIIFGISLAGGFVIPDYKYLRAHHNKVFMEILRDLSDNDGLKNIASDYFGAIEELELKKDKLENGQYVVKPAMGSMSKGIFLAQNYKDIYQKIKSIIRTRNYKDEFKDRYRKTKYKGFVSESLYRKKFLVQNLIPNLQGDWKILIYNGKYYPLSRKNRKNDFRASGGGQLAYTRELPPGMLDFAKRTYHTFNSPNISIDIAFDGKSYYLIEIQFLHFGTYTIEHSEFYFVHNGTNWNIIEEKSIVEKEYARSVAEFIKNGCHIRKIDAV